MWEGVGKKVPVNPILGYVYMARILIDMAGFTVDNVIQPWFSTSYICHSLFPYLWVVSFPQVVREVMLDVVGELLLVLRVEFEHFDDAENVYAFQVAVCKGLDVTRRLDDGFRTGLQIHVNVTSNQVPLTCVKWGCQSFELKCKYLSAYGKTTTNNINSKHSTALLNVSWKLNAD